jgi:plastocyanin
MRARIVFLTAAIAGLAAGCGGSSGGSTPTPTPTPTTPTTPTGFFITISGLRFSPLNLDVPPGATVTVVNQDGATQHSVTSEERAGAFTPGAVGGVAFDTNIFTGQQSFTIPMNAAEGTVVPYYCRNHMSTMVTPTGTVTIRAAAQPGPAPSGTSGGTGGGTGGGMGGGGGGY